MEKYCLLASPCAEYLLYARPELQALLAEQFSHGSLIQRGQLRLYGEEATDMRFESEKAEAGRLLAPSAFSFCPRGPTECKIQFSLRLIAYQAICGVR